MPPLCPPSPGIIPDPQGCHLPGAYIQLGETQLVSAWLDLELGLPTPNPSYEYLMLQASLFSEPIFPLSVTATLEAPAPLQSSLKATRQPELTEQQAGLWCWGPCTTDA